MMDQNREGSIFGGGLPNKICEGNVLAFAERTAKFSEIEAILLAALTISLFVLTISELAS